MTDVAIGDAYVLERAKESDYCGQEFINAVTT